MTHRLATNYAKSFCNRTPIVKVIVGNVVTCFLGHSVVSCLATNAINALTYLLTYYNVFCT